MSVCLFVVQLLYNEMVFHLFEKSVAKYSCLLSFLPIYFLADDAYQSCLGGGCEPLLNVWNVELCCT